MSIYNAMGIILSWKKIKDMLEINILKIPHKKITVSWRMIFEGLGAHIMLARTMDCWLTNTAD